MKKKLNIIASAFFLMLVAVSCAVTDFDRTVNFQQYDSYAWAKSEIDVENPVYRGDLIDKNIKSTVDNEMAKRGIVVDKNDPDFLISYKTYTEQKQKTTGGSGYAAYPFMMPYFFSPFRFGMWGMPYGMYGTTPRVETVTEGTLIVDITDAKTNELVWRGTVKGSVDDVKSLQRQIRKGIKAILKKYPVTPKQPLRELNTDGKAIS